MLFRWDWAIVYCCEVDVCMFEEEEGRGWRIVVVADC